MANTGHSTTAITIRLPTPVMEALEKRCATLGVESVRSYIQNKLIREGARSHHKKVRL